MFQLNFIRVENGSAGQKILLPEKYQFIDDNNRLTPDNFYGENISVSAIVGKNGSGKSSLLDLIYRVLNNISAILCNNLKQEGYVGFTFVSNLKVELSFNIDGTSYGITCKDNSVFLHIRGESSEKKISFGRGEARQDYVHINELTDNERQEIANGIFYCIALNYAPFAMNSNEYDHEHCVAIEDNLIPGRINLKNHNWMQSIFHKNDGYQSNITFVPYRSYGTFDADKESKLNRERLLEILVVHSNFIDGYHLGNVKLRVVTEIFRDKFNCTRPSRENLYKPLMDVNDLINKFEQILIDYKDRGCETIATRILQKLKINRQDVVIESPFIYSYLYLVYKVLNAAQYPIFQKYHDLNNPDLAIERLSDRELLNKASLLAGEVWMNHSHITFKIERVLNFLSVASKLNWDKICSEGYTLEEYWLNFPEKLADETMMAKARHLPPSFLSPEIFLFPNEKMEDEISFEMLSSGERQFYSTISAIVYHSMNLISAQSDLNRVKYRNLLVVLDEVEMCFHPEYQRTFLNRLISTINRLEFNKYLSYHFLLTSHSPFILSDIPATNILYLEKGKPVIRDNLINPFGANINDILSQSFFLENGFIGQQALEIIKSLYKYLDENDNNETIIHWNKDNSKQVIGIIGEQLLRNTLNMRYLLKFESLEELECRKLEIEELIRKKGAKHSDR